MGNNSSKFQQQMAVPVLGRHSLAISQLLTGCNNNVTVLTANTTKSCTPRNLFLMVRVYTYIATQIGLFLMVRVTYIATQIGLFLMVRVT